MEDDSPLQCPTTVTIRRNPPRRARPTPSNTAIKTTTAINTPKNLDNIPNFPINDILSIDLQNQPSIPPSKPPNSLNVFLRIRPLPIPPNNNTKPSKLKQVMAVKPSKSCVTVNGCNSVTVSPPNCDSSRLKSEVYNGFSHVFDSHSSQDEVYEKLMRPMVDEFLNGRSGLLAALGPSGSGKTHTVFGSAKDPGLVPRVLSHIFDLNKGTPPKKLRMFYMSIFEIYSEKGKGEKLSDLSPEGSDVHMQQSVVKGLKEVVVKDVAQAESVLAYAKSKRVTAMTNSNSQSSRSQCIITIRCVADEAEGESESTSSEAVLTFVDLAGAEREKKTGNKGGRLLESNFINNTSMVFGLCLRSLLEHQRNPKKPLQKHFQSSLLTRYLRDYLEGRKRMALILTVRSGEEDYFDTSSLLRQASPYMEIKFSDTEETSNLPYNKRRRQIIGNEQQKRAKLSGADARDDVDMTSKDSEKFPKENPGGNKRNHASRVCENSPPHVSRVGGKTGNSLLKVNDTDTNIFRLYNFMQGLSKALWAELKQYKERVKTMHKDIDVLTDNLKVGHAQYLAMKEELQNIKSRCSCSKEVLGVDSSMGGSISESNFSEEVLTDHEKVVSAEAKNSADGEYKAKDLLHTACEKYNSNLECELGGQIEQESLHQSSIPEFEATTSCWEEDVHFKEEVDICIPEAEFPCTVPVSKEEISSESMKEESQNFVEHGSAIVIEVHLRDSLPGLNILSGVKSVEPEEALLKSSHRATITSSINPFKMSSPGSYQVQQPVMECQISHDKINNNCHEKDERKECGEVSTDAASHFPRSPVMELTVQGKSVGCDSPNEKDKENVTNCPRSNINYELETKEVSHCESTKPQRPKRRLMPASSLLLRDAGNIDVADETGSHRGGRVGRKDVEDEHKRTRGNANLLRLLKNHLPR